MDAEHEESAPDATKLVITRMACSLAGKTETVNIMPGSLAYEAYRSEEAIEEFRCNYGLNPAYREQFKDGKLAVTGVDAEGEFRIIELPAHRYFVATLFLPQISSTPAAPHPLIVSYVQAAAAQG